MKRVVIAGVLFVVVILMSTVSVFAQEDDVEIYYVRRGHTGCEDGSQECPFSTLTEALDAGQAQVCDSRTFEIWIWNETTSEYEYDDSYSGAKPIPGTGVPIAMSLLIVLLVIGGLIALVVALRLRRRSIG